MNNQSIKGDIMKRDFYVVIEQDEDGVFIGEVPELQGCYSQGSSLDELMKNIKEVIELCLEDEAPGRLSGIKSTQIR
jgi:predicted RNase H-like HicB family nuclease